MRKLRVLIATTLILTLCSATLVSAEEKKTDCMGTEYCNCMPCECDNCIEQFLPTEAQEQTEESVPEEVQILDAPVTENIIGVVIADSTLTGLIDTINGVYIEDVMPNSPAAEAGIYRGDFITGFNGQDVTCVTELLNYVAQTNVGDEVTVTITLVNSYGYFKQIDYVTTVVNRHQFARSMGRGNWAFRK